MAEQMTLFDSNGSIMHIDERGRELVDPRTGEHVYLQAVRKPYYGEKHFWKIFLLDFLAVLGIIESKQLDVVIYIMEHTSPYNNQFIGSNRSIAAELGISRDTVQRTMKKLLNCNFITKTKMAGVYQVNPSVMVQGSAAKQRGLLVQYQESNDPAVIAEATALGVLPETTDGEVVVEAAAEVIDNA